MTARRAKGNKELIVEEDSAHIDGYRTGALASDHFELNKFTGPKDGRYISVSGEISSIVQKSGGILKSRQNGVVHLTPIITYLRLTSPT